MNRFSRLAAYPIVDFFYRGGYESTLPPDRHSLGGPPLYDGSWFTKEGGDLSPSLEFPRTNRRFWLRIGFGRHITFSDIRWMQPVSTKSMQAIHAHATMRSLPNSL